MSTSTPVVDASPSISDLPPHMVSCRQTIVSPFIHPHVRDYRGGVQRRAASAATPAAPASSADQAKSAAAPVGTAAAEVEAAGGLAEVKRVALGLGTGAELAVTIGGGGGGGGAGVVTIGAAEVTGGGGGGGGASVVAGAVTCG